MSVSIQRTDTIAVEVTFKDAGGESLEKLAGVLKEAARDGYKLVHATELTDGHQRDPTTTGVALLLRRP